MIEYWDIIKYIKKKADLYNYINPFFNFNYMKSHNFFYIQFALEKYKNYFENIYIEVDPNIHLDINQKKAILVSPKNELIIAGAGSGKTTTVAAKIKFMVDILKVNPDDILLLSYTNEAVDEMKRIIVDKFDIKTNIMTFHKFAIILLSNVKNIKESISYDEVINKYNMTEKLLLFSYLYIFTDITIKDIKLKSKNFLNSFHSFEHDFNKYFYENLTINNNIKSMLFKKNINVFKNKIDSNILTFDSLIYNAYKLNEYKNHYKYILIDEYQDISNLRFNFIKKYVSKENAKLMCVGDDWQTIFSFASSNINNILNFDKAFNDTLTLKIVNTYRNSQELIDIAGNFIMKNKRQIKKNLKSIKHIENPIEFIEYKNKNDLINKISIELDKIIDKEIAFISRYKFDIKMITDNDVFKIINERVIYKNQKEIFFYTIHASKGLGFDYVFILNHKRGYYGFPPSRRNIDLFKEEKAILEERRLYYVALTRTKNKVYLVYPSKKNSLFLKEMKKMLKKK